MRIHQMIVSHRRSQTMRAAVVSQACDETVEIVERETPKVGPGEAMVDVGYCGVCHNLHVAHGDFGKVPGRILGHEGLGLSSWHPM